MILLQMYFSEGMAPIGPMAMSAGKKAALATLGMFTGVGGAVAFKLDQVRFFLPASYGEG
jgi:hypothetical protein